MLISILVIYESYRKNLYEITHSFILTVDELMVKKSAFTWINNIIIHPAGISFLKLVAEVISL